MQSPRCISRHNSYSVYHSKWNTFYFPQSSEKRCSHLKCYDANYPKKSSAILVFPWPENSNSTAVQDRGRSQQTNVHSYKSMQNIALRNKQCMHTHHTVWFHICFVITNISSHLVLTISKGTLTCNLKVSGSYQVLTRMFIRWLLFLWKFLQFHEVGTSTALSLCSSMKYALSFSLLDMKTEKLSKLRFSRWVVWSIPRPIMRS